MRILVSCLQSLRPHPISAYQFWRQYFVQGLHEAGHEVLEVPDVDWAEALTHPEGFALDRWRSRTWEAVESYVRNEHERARIDLFLGYLYPSHVDTSAIHLLRSWGIPCVNFFCDNVRNFVKVPEAFRPFSLHWVPEFEALPMYRDAGLPYINAAMPCWVSPDLRTVPSEETEPATFIGSKDLLRLDLFSRAMSVGADFVVRGTGWIEQSNGYSKANQPRRSMARMISNQIAYYQEHGLSSLFCKVAEKLYPLREQPLNQSRIKGTLSDSSYISVTRQASVTLGVNRVVTAKSNPVIPRSTLNCAILKRPCWVPAI